MARKSKSQSSRPFFTSHEREKAKAAGSGTVTAHLGQDSQLAFGQCGLCLSYATIDPVATPAGFVYCRECIVSNLLEQKKTLELQRQQYEEEQEELRSREAAKAEEAQLEQARRFATMETGVGAGAMAAAAASAGAMAGAGSSSEAAIVGALLAKKAEKMDSRSRAQQVEEAKASSFWAPAAVPSAAKSRIAAAPDPHPRDPLGGDFLRAKQLLAVKLTKIPEEGLGISSSSSSSSSAALESVSRAGDGGSTGRARFSCPACLKALTVQKVYLLTGCGDTICGDCCKKFVVPTKRCLQCNLEVRGKEGIIALRQGGSSYAGHEGTVATASQYKPTLLC